MKSCNEMVLSLLERKRLYEIEVANKRRILIRTGTPAICTCLALMVGFGIWREHGKEAQAQPFETTVNSAPNSIQATASVPAANNKIVINHCDVVPSARFNICLLLDDFVKMNPADYYGIDVFPSVPEDLSQWGNTDFGIFRRNGGIGQVYWDQIVLNYANKDLSRRVNAEIRKGGLPLLDYGFDYGSGQDDEKKSLINNCEVTVVYNESFGFYALFMYKNVGFMVNGFGISQDEFVEILCSIIQ